jgi:tRNA (adenine57-N1/adenine58-N1)-methyltransferase catalytic subunit
MLGVRQGSICLEAGTGSGFFTRVLASRISSHGKIYTFEFNGNRYEENLKEFSDHGLNNIVTAQHADVGKDGFKNVELADCVFLDMPNPWDAISHLPTVLKRDRTTRFGSLSPCIGQVLDTHSALRKVGFTNIVTCTLRTRNYRPFDVKLRALNDALEDIRFRNRSKEERKKGSVQLVEEKANTDRRHDRSNWKIASRGEDEVRGHSGFLTFAELMPIIEKTEEDC